MNQQIINSVFENVLKSALEAELNEVGTKLTKILSKYGYLFGDQKTFLGLLIEGYFRNYEQQNEVFNLDFNYISDNTPYDYKEKLFNYILNSFSKKVSIEDLKEESATFQEHKEGENIIGEFDEHLDSI
ncbi:MAG TPA: hypothetical protein VEY70_13245 [Metabacillus sp.]|nr:hypothetical protein [Metabacillus sp.]